ncbi:MAG: pirin family protein [Phycisphaerales bacterium]|nr:pirin family protein [Phycisphaerales bacterium]MCI0674674.1 pirin family protein [Phycisphaerales bacterium]
MINIRKSTDRGHFNHGWLDTYHTFSFGNYNDPNHMGFSALRVINEDRVAPGQGFGMHPHRDMEIVTYVLEGALQHRDSMGHSEVLRPGEVQRMTAGTGILHSEFNPSKTDPVHLYQIWLLPRQRGATPSYEQKAFPVSVRANQMRLVASPDGRDGSTTIGQDAEIYATNLARNQSVLHELKPGRNAWVQVVRGDLSVNGKPLARGDAAALSGESRIELNTTSDAEALVFDLP